MDLLDQYDLDYDDSKRSTFTRLEGSLSSLDLHSYGARNRSGLAGNLARPTGSSATKLTQLSNDRHPNLDMVLETDNKITFNDTLFSFMDGDDNEEDEYRDTTFGWLLSVYHDDGPDDLSDTTQTIMEQLPKASASDSSGYEEDNKENQQIPMDSGLIKKKRTYELIRMGDHQAVQEDERKPLEDWPSLMHTEMSYQPTIKKKHVELVASTSIGSNSSSSSSTTTDWPRFIRSLSPPLLPKGKERAS